MGPRGLIFPPIAWLLLLIARSAKTLYRNRQTYPAGFGRNLARLILLVPIIATLDAAAFIGSLNWRCETSWTDRIEMTDEYRRKQVLFIRITGCLSRWAKVR
jgi:hypothetical protein